MEVKTEDEMDIVKHEVTMGGDGNGEANATVKDPLQKFVDNITEERSEKISSLYKVQHDLSEAVDILRDMSTKDRNNIAEMVDLLKDLGKLTGIAENNSIGDGDEGISAIRKYINNITLNVKKIMQKCRDMECGLMDCQNTAFQYEEELKSVKAAHTQDQDKMLHMSVTYERHIKNVVNAHKKEVAVLEKELSEKDKKLKQLQEEVDKAAKIQKLKRMNEERVMTRKELEDLEDSLSKEMKILHMRKVYVQGMHAKVKPPIPEDEKQREVIEKSLTTSIKNMNSLKVEIGRIQKIVQQNSTRH